MQCYRPIDAWRSKERGKSGKRKIVFRPDDAVGFKLQLPCGQCIGCRLERSRQWAMRCVHEASLYENNCFITLTYNEACLPRDGSLNKKHFQDFMKRLRSRFPESPIRYYHCGEYGELHRRPHYHACLFNFDFLDRILFKEERGTRLYTSDVLASLWPMGFSTVGDVTFESAAYVARYIMKKVSGARSRDHYISEPDENGEVFSLLPEYTTMSRRPGIASDWFAKFGEEVFPDDFVVLRGRKMKPPRFYDSIYEVADPDEYARLKRQRVKDAIARDYPGSPTLEEREVVKSAQVGMLKRSL